MIAAPAARRVIRKSLFFLIFSARLPQKQRPLKGSLSSHRITGLDDEQIEELASRLETRIEWDKQKGRPRKLTLRQALRSVVLLRAGRT